MKSTAIILSAAAFTLLSGAAMAYPELPPMPLTPAQLAAAQPTPSGPDIEHAVMVKEHVSQNAPTPFQQCQALEKRFDRNPAPAALKSAATPRAPSAPKAACSASRNPMRRTAICTPRSKR